MIVMDVFQNFLAVVLYSLLFIYGKVYGGLIGTIETLQHDVSGTLYFIDSRTIFIDNFNYDGQGPGAFMYFYRPGDAVDPQGGGITIPLPAAEFGQGPSESYPGALQNRAYRNVDIMLTLPEGFDTCDISTFTVWCMPFRAFFGRLDQPVALSTFVNNGADPCILVDPGLPAGVGQDFDNCKVLDETLQLSWRVDNDNSQVQFQLCGCATDPNTIQYLGFGLSGSESQTLMFQADATIAWVDENGQGQAQDYYLSQYSQCRGGSGACPDTMDATVASACTNDVSDISGFVEEGQQCISFTRPFNPTDSGTCDRPIDPANQNQFIVWGIGSLGDTAFQHHTRATAMDDPIHLGRAPLDECAGVELMCQQCDPFPAQQIVAREDTTFTAVIGPSANPRGYTGITGRPGWGIAWFINDTIIPELVVERGRNYKFLVYGGDDPADASNYHPFYITDSISGGRLLNSQEERVNEAVFAGFSDNDEETAVGALCRYSEVSQSEVLRQSCGSYQDYFNSLEFGCRNGTHGKLLWTPDENTPDLVYYQCASHLNLGYAIRVINSGDPIPPPLVPGQGTGMGPTDGAQPLRLSGILMLLSFLVMMTLKMYNVML